MNAVTKTVLALGAVVIVCGISSVTPSSAGVVGRIIVAGHGPELPVMQDLGRAFEKAHPGTAIDFEWDRTVKAVERVKAGEAQVAVTDHPDPALKTVPIAWDGIAVIVNFANPVSELTTAQVRDLFTGKITRWSDLDGGDQVVEVLPRAAEDNMQFGLEMSLGIAGRFRATGPSAISRSPRRSKHKETGFPFASSRSIKWRRDSRPSVAGSIRCAGRYYCSLHYTPIHSRRPLSSLRLRLTGRTSYSRALCRIPEERSNCRRRLVSPTAPLRG